MEYMEGQYNGLVEAGVEKIEEEYKEYEKVVDDFKALLLMIPPEVRLELICGLDLCLHCGKTKEERGVEHCYCMNDE